MANSELTAFASRRAGGTPFLGLLDLYRPHAHLPEMDCMPIFRRFCAHSGQLLAGF